MDPEVGRKLAESSARMDEVHRTRKPPYLYHDTLYLMGIERTGWRRWIFGRWVYSSEAFRRDIQRKNKHLKDQLRLEPWERICDPED